MKKLINIKIRKNVSLSSCTTLRVGGSAEYFVEVESKRQLREVASLAKLKQRKLFVIGEGSDILVSDKNFSVIVVKLTNKKVKIEGEMVYVDAGVKWDDLVELVIGYGLVGIECMSGIPGTVGAAPVQNIGAYGQELKGVLEKIEVYDTEDGQFKFLSNEDCKFSYRDSIFKDKTFKNRYIIFKVILKLSNTKKIKIEYESIKNYLSENEIEIKNATDLRDIVLTIRSQKLDDPRKIANAGSFFKNPIIDIKKFEVIQKDFPSIPSHLTEKGIKLFAGWLIESCGWKGRRLGNVGVSSKNALVLVNYGGRADDIERLSKEIVKDVYKKFSVELHPEVQFVNF